MLHTRCVPAETPCGLTRPNLALDSLEFLSNVTSEPPRLLQIEERYPCRRMGGCLNPVPSVGRRGP